MRLPSTTIKIFDSTTNETKALITKPRKIIIRSGFGAQERRCWLEVYNEDIGQPIELRDSLEININQSLVFSGTIKQRRIDSVDDYLTFFANLYPEKKWDIEINSHYIDKTISEILEDIISQSEMTLESIPYLPEKYQELTFNKDSIFAVIDILSKLAGNYFWDISDDGIVYFRSPYYTPDHVIYLHPDESNINIWEKLIEVPEEIIFKGGIVDGTIYEKQFHVETVTDSTKPVDVYARSINSIDTYTALQLAIEEQYHKKIYEHYIDLERDGEKINPGETIKFISDHPLFPYQEWFRVKSREIIYAHERYRTRFYLTTGFESTSTYLYYLNDDKINLPIYDKGRSGMFQLDVSALDSAAHLDPE